MKKPVQKNSPEDEQPDENGYLGPSKSQLKRESTALQDLGKELTELSAEQLERLELPEDIHLCVSDYKRMKSFGAQRRQLQLIGKVMRQLDGPSVREAIDRVTGESRAAVAAHHRAEKTRDALLLSDDNLTRYLAERAQESTDVQQLRQLVRNARKEREAGKPPKYVRALYRHIYALELPAVNLYGESESQDDADWSAPEDPISL